MAGRKWLDDTEARAWRGYLSLRALLDLQISRDLAADSGLSEPDYHVLATLSAHRPATLRLNDLATGMLWSTSRLAHHLDRMQQRGLVRRGPLPGNSRAAVVSLTDEGRAVLRRAAPAHAASVRRHFTGVLDEHQLAAFADATEIVNAHLQRPQEQRPGTS